jgi:hypothetical protein
MGQHVFADILTHFAGVMLVRLWLHFHYIGIL